jgi:hypothetical protein
MGIAFLVLIFILSLSLSLFRAMGIWGTEELGLWGSESPSRIQTSWTYISRFIGLLYCPIVYSILTAVLY